jgi:hypothetical protein
LTGDGEGNKRNKEFARMKASKKERANLETNMNMHERNELNSMMKLEASSSKRNFANACGSLCILQSNKMLVSKVPASYRTSKTSAKCERGVRSVIRPLVPSMMAITDASSTPFDFLSGLFPCC